MNERLTQMFRHPATYSFAIGLASFGCGTVVGYFACRRRIEKNTYVEHNPTGTFDLEGIVDTISAPSTIVIDEDDLPVIRERQESAISEGAVQGDSITIVPQPEPEPEEDPELVRKNIFDSDVPNWDQEAEEAGRKADEPFVLHRDEFLNSDTPYPQQTLTYYAGDEMLIDERDTPIYNIREVIGDFRFGHGSGDPNVFYIRNNKRRVEYEIIREEGSYEDVVLGLEADEEVSDELRHSGVPKFRQE